MRLQELRLASVHQQVPPPYVSAPVAADIIGDSKLELIEGGMIYSVDIVSLAENSAKISLTKKLSDYNSLANPNTSVVDYNQDGYLDVLAYGSRIRIILPPLTQPCFLGR